MTDSGRIEPYQFKHKGRVPPPAGIYAAQLRAMDCPLKSGLRFELDLTAPPQSTDPRYRPVPHIPLTAGSSTTALVLLEGLQTGLGNFSQVWTARVEAAPETILILKIIQPSMCYSADEEGWIENFEPDDLAGYDEWGYEHLQEKQGLSVPYFLGKHQIITPSGEEAWALVLEYIPGPTLSAVCDSKVWDDVHTAFDLGFEFVREITDMGLFLNDVRGPNFILTGPPDSRQVVGIDFVPIGPLGATKDRTKIFQEEEFFHVMMTNFVAGSEDSLEMIKWARDKYPNKAHIWDKHATRSGL
ncbi:hypothetical protein B0H15DRAFT_1023739 [Mycena belliarum]|uniref:Protein kinase domain-containing protein n=1 Tax=Mycena belliarum TaxID=1033014 RepID=A0AAD6XKE2_9AGAR|nr:hypothetical protein B0H15DRAFT_1023739 [Mycena belliae]